MLTGRRVRRRRPDADLAAIVKDEPDWNALPANTPPAIRRLLRRTLTKESGNAPATSPAPVWKQTRSHRLNNKRRARPCPRARRVAYGRRSRQRSPWSRWRLLASCCGGECGAANPLRLRCGWQCRPFETDSRCSSQPSRPTRRSTPTARPVRTVCARYGCGRWRRSRRRFEALKTRSLSSGT